jgi:3-methyladenine DNA glycosylase/8-oxoguanine DNA glycosylase
MRGSRDPDAFPAGDLGLRHAFKNAGGGDARALRARADRWRPWRAYATVHLWHHQSTPMEKQT